jgi:hypothetical protein
MGYFYSGVDPAYIYKRKGDNTDPYVSLHETAQVVNGVITLKEIPDYPTKVIVKKLDGTTLTEVTSATLQANQYRVDYTTGVVYFPNTLEGNKLTLDYKGTGYVSFPASRVWVDTDNTASGKTIQQLVTDMDNVKTNWLTTVNTYSNIATTYPTPSLGDTVQTTNDGRIYRFNGSTWVNTQQYTSNAITDFQNRLDGLSKVPNEYEWIATQGQLTYTFPANSQYDPNSKWLDVSVGGARVSPSLVQKNSSTQFTLLVNPSDIPSGVRVVAKWIEGFISATQGHKGTHEVGGFDEIDVTKLKNYQESISTPISTLTTQLVQKASGQDIITLQSDVNNVKLSLSDIAKHHKIVKLIGDEITDDTAAIQTAIDQNSVNHIWTIIPEGNYKITSPLILKTGTRLLLHKNARLARYHNDSMFQNGVTGDMSGHSDITVIGGKIDLRGHILNTSNSMDGSGFALGYAKDIWIRDVEIYNVFYSHGMELCALDNVFVERCGFYGFIVDSANTRNTVEAIQIERGTSLGFPYFGTGDNTISKNIRIHHCIFGASDNAPSFPTAIGTHQADTILTADNIEIIGCVTKEPLTYRVTQLRGYKNVTFERNTMTAPTGVTIYDDGASVSKVRLRNNKITSTTIEAVHVEGVDGFSSDGNTFDGYTNALYLKGVKNIKLGESDDYYSQTSDTVVIFGSSAYMVANGMTIRKSGRHAFNIYDGSNHIKVLNTMILDVADTGNAFNLQGANTKVIQIRGNHITDSVLNNVLSSTSGADRVFFNDNFYAASITTPINSAATNSDTIGNHTF